MFFRKISRFSMFLLIASMFMQGINFIEVKANDDIASKRGSIVGDLSIELRTKNTLELTINTQSIVFDGYDGTMDFHNNFNLTVSSSLNYDINVKMNEEFRRTNDDSRVIESSLLSMTDETLNNEVFFNKINEYLPIIKNSELGVNKVHPIKLKLMAQNKSIKGNYRTSFTTQIIQK